MSTDLSTLQLSELYDELIPPEAPPDISMMPQTAGWYWLGAAVLLLIAYLLRLFIRHHQRNAYRREALTALRHADNDPTQIASILRQTALAAFPRDQVAGVVGDDWLAFLDDTAGKPLFKDTSAGQSLLLAPYRDMPADPKLAPQAHKWIRQHKVKGAA
ncbi:DUF4381 domain-containing protein [Falsihalocynthiibacter sp. SS001]|uniref:DUF4381 domain-containing protein n=1 Tax=Falsihalocynthiibacter sp. SS001 TaxID=3349698 RepID=UPI0036D288AF